MAGPVIGCLPLLAWGRIGRSVAFGATLPGSGYSNLAALLGEIMTTFTMVSLLVVFIGFRHTRPFSPGIFPILYAIMVPLEAAISGTSTNPASWSGGHIRSMAWMVDLLDRSVDRRFPGIVGLQFPREANHGSRALPF
jgi:aquaporin Z